MATSNTLYDDGIVSYVLFTRNVMCVCSQLEVPFPNERLAEIARQVMSVDKEPSKSRISRVVTREEATLKVYGCKTSFAVFDVGVRCGAQVVGRRRVEDAPSERWVIYGLVRAVY